MNTCNISAAAYDEALEFCNKRLAEQNKPLITELPPGIPDDEHSCPCSNACGAVVYGANWLLPNKRHADGEHWDGPVRFVREFDTKNRGIKEPVLPIRMETP